MEEEKRKKKQKKKIFVIGSIVLAGTAYVAHKISELKRKIKILEADNDSLVKENREQGIKVNELYYQLGKLQHDN